MPQLATFIANNFRWLAGGFLLTMFSAHGQTFFISLSANEIRSEFDLSHGEFGTLYMFATLASAATLPYVGQVVDFRTTKQIVVVLIPALAVSTLFMAWTPGVLALVFAIYLLRLCGQGMMTHMALTATARWFAANRGKAVSMVGIGLNTAEALFPTIFVAFIVAYGWRVSWVISGGILLLLVLPLTAYLLRDERVSGTEETVVTAKATRDWTRGEVLRDGCFYLLLLGVLAPGFIGTTIYFHQAYLVELRGWSMEAFAASFAVLSLFTVACALISGVLIDRFSALRLLPVFLFPLALACFVLAGYEQSMSMFIFMALLGVSYGFSSTLVGALWAEVYGVKYLGRIRSIIVAVGVFATAMGPGITGYLIDLGVSYSAQIATMGVYCLLACVTMYVTTRIIIKRQGKTLAASGVYS